MEWKYSKDITDAVPGSILDNRPEEHKLTSFVLAEFPKETDGPIFP